MKAQQFITTFSTTLSTNREKWIKCLESNDLDDHVDNIIDQLVSIRKRKRTGDLQDLPERTPSSEGIELRRDRERSSSSGAIELSRDRERSSSSEGIEPLRDTRKKIFTIEDEINAESQTEHEHNPPENATNLEFEDLHQPYLTPKIALVSHVSQSNERIRMSKRPVCFDMFDMQHFIKFVEMRQKLDDYFESVIEANPNSLTFDHIIDVINVIINSKDNWFKNIHMIAYLYHKLAKYPRSRFSLAPYNLVTNSSKIDREKIILQLFPKLESTFVINKKSFALWSPILAHGHELQWLAGIVVYIKPTTIYNWRVSLSNYQGEEYFGTVTINGEKCVVPVPTKSLW
jgi:hypothetical protein